MERNREKIKGCDRRGGGGKWQQDAQKEVIAWYRQNMFANFERNVYRLSTLYINFGPLNRMKWCTINVEIKLFKT